MVELSAAVLFLPDGRVVLNRRGNDREQSPGLLGMYGGHFEKGESAWQCMNRELEEETSLKAEETSLQYRVAFDTPEGSGVHAERRLYFFVGKVQNADFKVFEGQRSEVYSISEALDRDDLSPTTKRALEYIQRSEANG